MLIITRRAQESVIIGNDVRVTVLGIKGNQVRIGVVAPANVEVDREELRDKKNLERGVDGAGIRKILALPVPRRPVESGSPPRVGTDRSTP